jgi:hypothetical protein
MTLELGYALSTVGTTVSDFSPAQPGSVIGGKGD